MIRSLISNAGALVLGYFTAVLIINGPHHYDHISMLILGAMLALGVVGVALVSVSLRVGWH